MEVTFGEKKLGKGGTVPKRGVLNWGKKERPKNLPEGGGGGLWGKKKRGGKGGKNELKVKRRTSFTCHRPRGGREKKGPFPPQGGKEGGRGGNVRERGREPFFLPRRGKGRGEGRIQFFYHEEKLGVLGRGTPILYFLSEGEGGEGLSHFMAVQGGKKRKRRKIFQSYPSSRPRILRKGGAIGHLSIASLQGKKEEKRDLSKEEKEIMKSVLSKKKKGRAPSLRKKGGGGGGRRIL